MKHAFRLTKNAGEESNSIILLVLAQSSLSSLNLSNVIGLQFSEQILRSHYAYEFENFIGLQYLDCIKSFELDRVTNPDFTGFSLSMEAMMKSSTWKMQ